MSIAQAEYAELRKEEETGKVPMGTGWWIKAQRVFVRKAEGVQQQREGEGSAKEKPFFEGVFVGEESEIDASGTYMEPKEPEIRELTEEESDTWREENEAVTEKEIEEVRDEVQQLKVQSEEWKAKSIPERLKMNKVLSGASRNVVFAIPGDRASKEINEGKWTLVEVISPGYSHKGSWDPKGVLWF